MHSPSERLCQACGLCCDGTLFSSAPLDEKEAKRAPHLKLRVVTREDGTVRLQQPCAALDGLRCTVYASRPSICRSYRCDLLGALEENEVSLSEALELVARVRKQSALVESLLPADSTRDRAIVHPRLAAWRLHRPDEGQPLPVDLLGELHVLEELLVHHFLGRRGH